MKCKYLLTMHCDGSEWCDSCFNPYPRKAYHRREEFELDDEEGLIKVVAWFIERYPQGDYEIYIIQEFEREDYEHESKIANIKQEAEALPQKIKEEKRLKEIEEKNKQKVKEQERIKQQELKTLKELKAKYELSNNM